MVIAYQNLYLSQVLQGIMCLYQGGKHFFFMCEQTFGQSDVAPYYTYIFSSFFSHFHVESKQLHS